jgi:hypothetical protein
MSLLHTPAVTTVNNVAPRNITSSAPNSARPSPLKSDAHTAEGKQITKATATNALIVRAISRRSNIITSSHHHTDANRRRGSRQQNAHTQTSMMVLLKILRWLKNPVEIGHRLC